MTTPPNLGCTVAPDGWWCSREPGHDGPCAARPASGTAAPDPRAANLRDVLHDASDVPAVLAMLDNDDRAAGVIRVRTDDATVEKIAKVLALRDYGDYGKDTEYAWTGLSDYGRWEYLTAARAVLEALVTP